MRSRKKGIKGVPNRRAGLGKDLFGRRNRGVRIGNRGRVERGRDCLMSCLKSGHRKERKKEKGRKKGGTGRTLGGDSRGKKSLGWCG